MRRPWVRRLACLALQQVISDLQALRGIADISAVTIARELGQVSRFHSARQLIGYCGVVPSEIPVQANQTRRHHEDRQRAPATHCCRNRMELSSSARYLVRLRRRQESISEEVKEIAWKAQHRLHKRYVKLGAAGKDQRKIVTAVARELLGFIWAIGTRAETVSRQQVAA
jgi:transposase